MASFARPQPLKGRSTSISIALIAALNDLPRRHGGHRVEADGRALSRRVDSVKSLMNSIGVRSQDFGAFKQAQTIGSR
jgi:hypothetical protein